MPELQTAMLLRGCPLALLLDARCSVLAVGDALAEAAPELAVGADAQQHLKVSCRRA